jgi:hypothetical protein
MSIQITVLPSGTSIIEVDGAVQTFETEVLAQAAVAVIENGAQYAASAADFCTFKGYTDRNAVGKTNVITEFLAWVDAGKASPAPVADDANVDLAPAFGANANIQF